MGSTIASKLTDLSIDNTSLTQCNTTHLAALRSSNYTGEVTSLLSCLHISSALCGLLVCVNECDKVTADRSTLPSVCSSMLCKYCNSCKSVDRHASCAHSVAFAGVPVASVCHGRSHCMTGDAVSYLATAHSCCLKLVSR